MTVLVRRARTPDVPQVKELVDIYAGSGRKLLAKELVTLYEDVQDFVVAEDEDAAIVGCGALHVLWADLGEVRTLAVHPSQTGKHVGGALLDQLLENARGLGLTRVFALTSRLRSSRGTDSRKSRGRQSTRTRIPRCASHMTRASPSSSIWRLRSRTPSATRGCCAFYRPWLPGGRPCPSPPRRCPQLGYVCVPSRTQTPTPSLALHSNAYVLRYWDSPPWTDRRRAKQFLAACERMAEDGTGARFAIDRADDTFIGWCSLTQWNPNHRSASLGYCFSDAAWGHGYATEAARALLHWAFETLDLNRVQAATDTRNAASARVLEKLGFVREGTLREDCIVNGDVSDSWVYGLIRREWRPST